MKRPRRQSEIKFFSAFRLDVALTLTLCTVVSRFVTLMEQRVFLNSRTDFVKKDFKMTVEYVAFLFRSSFNGD